MTERAKSLEQSLRERERMKKRYGELVSEWKERAQSEPGFGGLVLPSTLNEHFALVKTRRSWRPEEPNFYFTYLSDYGFMELDIWTVDLTNRTAVASIELYTQGADGLTRGKGKLGMQETARIVQQLANATNFTFLDLVTTNQGSDPLVTSEGGFMPLTKEQTEEIHKKHVPKGQETRWDTALKLGPSRIKTYAPLPQQEKPTESEAAQIEAVQKIFPI